MLLLLALSLTNAALPPQCQTQFEVERILNSPHFKKMSKGMIAPSAAELTASQGVSPLGDTEYNFALFPNCEGGVCPMYVLDMNVTILPYPATMPGPLVFGLLYSPEGVVEAAPGRSDKPPMPFAFPPLGPGPVIPPYGVKPFEPTKLGASMAAPASKQSSAADGVEAIRKEIEAIVVAMGISGALLKEIEDMLAKTAAGVAGGVAGVVAEELLRRELEKLLSPIVGPFGPLGPGPVLPPFGPFGPFGPFNPINPIGPIGPVLPPVSPISPVLPPVIIPQPTPVQPLPIGPIGPIFPIFPLGKQLDAKVHEQTLKVGEMGYLTETAMTGYLGAQPVREQLGEYHAADGAVVRCALEEILPMCGGTVCQQQFYAEKVGETMVTNDRSNSVYKITVTE